MERVDSVLPNRMVIGGDRLGEGSRGHFVHRFPGDGTVQQQLPMAGPSEVDAAVGAATEALAVWRGWTGEARRDAIARLAESVGDHRDRLGLLLCRELGFPVAAAPLRVDSGQAWLASSAGWADKLYGQTHAREGFHDYSEIEPLGVVAIVPSWNGSIASFSMAAGPALAAGCTVVVKPSELAPFGPLRLAELAQEVGIPPGVINVVTGDGVTGDALISHPGIAKVAFTGSPATARLMASRLAPLLRPAVFELGGKSAVIVAQDAVLEEVVEKVASVAIGSGQQCTLGSRLLVHASVYDELTDLLKVRLEKIRVGLPTRSNVEMGPLATESALTRVIEIVSRAEGAGRRIVTGGARLEGDLASGYFIPPTLVADVESDDEIAQTELFAPVLTITPYQDDETAVAMANDSEFALAGYVFSKNIDRAIHLARSIDAENIGINGAFIPLGPALPFGGRRASGYGKQGGLAGVMEFARTRTFSVKLHHH